jgi:hypothetical protein
MLGFSRGRTSERRSEALSTQFDCPKTAPNENSTGAPELLLDRVPWTWSDRQSSDQQTTNSEPLEILPSVVLRFETTDEALAELHVVW